MALIKSFEKKVMEGNSLRDEVDASYSVFELDGRVLLQTTLTVGHHAKHPGKKSQSLQLDKVGAGRLVRILTAAFHL